MAQLKSLLLSLLNKKQLLIRLFLVWLLSFFVFQFDENYGFDLRFKLRSKQPVENSIVLVNISKKSWDRIINPSFPQVLRDSSPLSDSYFWSNSIWPSFISDILRESPKGIVVDLFFDNSVSVSWQVEKSFKLSPVLWRTEVDSKYGYSKAKFMINLIQKDSPVNLIQTNVALGYKNSDLDSTARQYQSYNYLNFIEDLPLKAVKEFYPYESSLIKDFNRAFINFRGPARTYPTVEINSVLSGAYPKDFFKNKVVLIGSNSMKEHFVKTPTGFLTRTEYQANIIDNILNDLWIKALPKSFYAVYLFLICLTCFLILHYFRQGLAVSFLILLFISLTSASIILFDIFNIWLPVLSPLCAIGLSYIILLNHLLAESEYAAWQSQKKEESLHEMNELKNNFVSLFSHDLKTPLAKIQAISDTLLQKNKDMDAMSQDSLFRIKEETRELNRYIQSILQVTRIEAGEFNLNLVPEDINIILQECISLMEPLYKSKNIKIVFQEEPLFPVEMDPKLIKEVFLNLIDNSIKYCPSGSLVEITSSDLGEAIEVTITDNGPGIKDSEQEFIFQKFARTGEVFNKKGTGLGLYLVRYFIEIHHGKVEVESQLGQGTSFKISLPYEQKDS